MTATFSLEVEVSRKAQSLPHYAIIPNIVAIGLGVNGTTYVDVWIGQSPRYRRTLKKWREEVWFVEFTAVQCTALNLFAGRSVQLHIALAESPMPLEFTSLLELDPVLRDRWEKVSPSVARLALEHIRQGKKAETRKRRAAELCERLIRCEIPEGKVTSG